MKKKYLLPMRTVDRWVEKNLLGMRKPVYTWHSWNIKKEDGELRPGPETDRVKIDNENLYSVDIIQGPKPVPKQDKNKVKFYHDGKPVRYENRKVFQPVSVFSTTYKVLDFFENPNAIGRYIPWAFKGRLTIKINIKETRKINDKYASGPFYSRSQGSIELPHYPNSKIEGGDRIYTSESPDIITHEVAHAIIDAIAPCLYQSKYAQTLAIHEAVADFTAFLFAMQMTTLRETLLERSNYNLKDASSLVQVAEQYARERMDKNRYYLRTLANVSNMADVDTSSVHELSTVLSGLFLDLICSESEYIKHEPSPERYENESENAKASRAIRIAKWKVENMLIRALDYLPPGDVGFYDLVNSIIAADKRAYPKKEEARIRNQLYKHSSERGITSKKEKYNKQTFTGSSNLLKNTDLMMMVENTDYRKQFCEENRQELSIPDKVEIFNVEAIKATKLYWRPPSEEVSGKSYYEAVSELILKASWCTTVKDAKDRTEVNRFENTIDGLTLVADWQDKSIEFSLVTSGRRGNRVSEEANKLGLCNSLHT